MQAPSTAAAATVTNGSSADAMNVTEVSELVKKVFNSCLTHSHANSCTENPNSGERLSLERHSMSMKSQHGGNEKMSIKTNFISISFNPKDHCRD